MAEGIKFTVTTEGADRLGLATLCQRFADEQWLALADHVIADDAAAIILDRFRRAVLAELELLEVNAERCQ